MACPEGKLPFAPRGDPPASNQLSERLARRSKPAGFNLRSMLLSTYPTISESAIASPANQAVAFAFESDRARPAAILAPEQYRPR